MRRGDVIIAAEKGSFAGKPRPWVVVQNRLFLDEPSSVTVCAVSASGGNAVFRIPAGPDAVSGLQEASLILADKIVTLRISAVEQVAGSIDDVTMARVDEAIRYWLDL